MSIRILVLFGNVPLYGNERANIETLAQLQGLGAEVLFLIRKGWTEQSIQPELRRRGLKFVTVPYFDSMRYGAGLKAWWNNVLGIAGGSICLLWHVKRFRATHFHIGSLPWVLNFLPGLVISRLPVVFRAGEEPMRHHAIWRFVWWYLCGRASRFVCDSEFIKKRLVGFGVKESGCDVIYAPPPDRPIGSGAPLIARNGLFTVLYVGQISKAKGVDFLVKVAMDLVSRHEIRFVLAGDYEWQNPLGQALRSLVQERGMEDKIRFLGYVDDIDGLYEVADLHVAPSTASEAYGLTVLEAKQRKCPSVVFPTGGLTELVIHGRDGWICKEPTAASLEEGIVHYFTSPERAIEDGLRAYESLSARLRVQDYGENWRSVYANVR